MFIGAGRGRQGWAAAGAVDDKVEAFLEVVDRGKFFDESGEFVGEVQGEGPD